MLKDGGGRGPKRFDRESPEEERGRDREREKEGREDIGGGGDRTRRKSDGRGKNQVEHGKEAPAREGANYSDSDKAKKKL